MPIDIANAMDAPSRPNIRTKATNNITFKTPELRDAIESSPVFLE